MSNTIEYKESADFQYLESMKPMKHLDIFDPLSLCYCGVEQCKPRYRFGPYIRVNYVIHVVLKGKGVYSVGGEDFPIQAGQAFLLRPGEETSYRADEEDPWKYVWIGFNGYKAEAVTSDMGFSERDYVIELNNVRMIYTAIMQILNSRDFSNAGDLQRMSKFYEAVYLLITGNLKKSMDKKEEGDELQKKYVKAAREYIMTSYNKKIRIAEIANAIGLNRSYLTSIFKKEMKMSPQDFLITIRMEKAAQMLRTTNESIRSIALSTGYDDSLQFSKAFKNKFNMTPSVYRKQHPITGASGGD
ncbi:MAG: AraC family transcriptional regulator [Lachnospiraceae bacterium]|nr:AraC family transcriptional regulator [Lachnospiraceae bacterium]